MVNGGLGRGDSQVRLVMRIRPRLPTPWATLGEGLVEPEQDVLLLLDCPFDLAGK